MMWLSLHGTINTNSPICTVTPDMYTCSTTITSFLMKTKESPALQFGIFSKIRTMQLFWLEQIEMQIVSNFGIMSIFILSCVSSYWATVPHIHFWFFIQIKSSTLKFVVTFRINFSKCCIFLLVSSLPHISKIDRFHRTLNYWPKLVIIETRFREVMAWIWIHVIINLKS